ncbi:MAG TPA: hypothetical protein VGY58_19320 [Gemmataceae bacterium]|nr:hypothetical protein [Gemmataceae bacterium]
MNMFGKVLAVVNVVLAIAFLCLIATDYSRRRAWEFTLLGQDFQVNGLAVDDDEKDAEGALIKDLATKPMQQQLGVQVSTQVQALDDRYKKCKSAIEGAGNGAAKKAEIVKYVLPLARTALEHYEIASAPNDAFDPEKELYKKLMGAEGVFDTAYNAGKKREASLDARRYAIAHFLFGTSAEQQDYEQTLAVVGLAAYARAVEAQEVHLAAMVPQLQREMDNDRTNFIASHRGLIEKIIALNSAVQDLQQQLAKAEDLLSQSRSVLAARRQDADDLTKRIAAATASAKNALSVQNDLEKELFAADAEAAKLKDGNEKLDGEIKRKELGR